MSKAIYLLALMPLPVAVALATGAGAPAGPRPAPSAEGAKPLAACKVRVDWGARGLRIEGVARGRGPISGDYAFRVEVRGAGGASTVVQHGDFTLRNDGEVPLAQMTLNRDADFSAELRLRWKGGQTECGSDSPVRI